MSRARILVVDDDRLIRELVRDALAEEGFETCAAHSGPQALDLMASQGPFDVALTDLSMREMDGLQLLEEIKRRYPKTDVIILTGYASLESALQAMRLGAVDYLRKPIKPPEILYCVNRTLLRRAALAESAALRGQVQTFEATRVLSSCLEAADVLPLTLDILLRVLGRQRAVGRLSNVAPRIGDGTVVRGFSDAEAMRLRTRIEGGKLCDPADLSGSGRGSTDALERELASMGMEEQTFLVLPISLDDQVVGGVWIPSDGREFEEHEIHFAELVIGQAELALHNSERFLQAREKAFIDDVTDLYNARYLFSALDREVTRAERSNRELSVLFLDLDRFKLVNDAHGHLVGSRVLRELGHLLFESLRSIDTVGRYGGDEFTILLVDTGLEGALRVAERIRQTVEETPFSGGSGVALSLTLSIGVATFPQHGQDRETLIDAADKSMYLGKSLGRNRVCSADELGERG